MNSVRVSAPGKLMLLGDHAVIYNRPCIATAVSQRMYLNASIIKENILSINAADVGIINYSKPINDLTIGEVPKGVEYVEHCVSNIFNKFNLKSGLKIETKSDFNSLLGFGSSSSSSVCTIKAISQLFNLNLSNKEIFDLAYKAVIDIKGIGSGYDIACAVYGGTLYFTTGGKIIEKLNIKSLPLVVGYTGVKADTATIVKDLANRMKNKSKTYNSIFDKIKNLVERAKVLLITEDFLELGIIFNLNQGYLKDLGVSSKILDDLIYAAIKGGAWGAKLSGAGIGDCMIAISPKSKTKSVINSIEKSKGKNIEIKTNVEGVRIERL